MIIKLSKIKFKDFRTCQDLIDFCVENNVESIENDFEPEPHPHYSLSDLFEVWDNFNELFQK